MVFCHMSPTFIHSFVPEPNFEDPFSPSSGAFHPGRCLKPTSSLSWHGKLSEPAAFQVRLDASGLSELSRPVHSHKPFVNLLHPAGSIPDTPLVP